MDADEVAARTRTWIEDFVIELGLCPFARTAVEAGAVRVEVSGATTPADLLVDLDAELRHLVEQVETETSFLVHPQVLADFLDYNDFLDEAEALLRRRELEGVLQIASFHPDYRFAGAGRDDAAHYTNRSPFPMLHLLREASVAEAVDAHPDPLEIPRRNAAVLRELGVEALRRRLAALRD